jgi:hypothetical protein
MGREVQAPCGLDLEMGYAGAGFAKLDHHPGKAFLELFVNTCMAKKLQGFDPQALSNVINGE